MQLYFERDPSSMLSRTPSHNQKTILFKKNYEYHYPNLCKMMFAKSKLERRQGMRFFLRGEKGFFYQSLYKLADKASWCDKSIVVHQSHVFSRYAQMGKNVSC